MSMTLEEARGILENLEAAYRDLDPLILTDESVQLVNERIEALGIVISALRAQDVPYTNVGDMVSMQKVIDLWNKYHPTIAVDAIAYDKALKSLPSAQPETAKRIVGKSMGGMTMWYQCDMCNEPVDAQDNFCRGCGRRLTDG